VAARYRTRLSGTKSSPELCRITTDWRAEIPERSSSTPWTVCVVLPLAAIKAQRERYDVGECSATAGVKQDKSARRAAPVDCLTVAGVYWALSLYPRDGHAMNPRIKTILAGGVLALVFLGVAAAGSHEDGEAAFQRGDYPTALRLFGKLAEGGDAIAQFYLGLMHAHGEGVPQDYAQAASWYRKAADQGNVDAQVNLGWMYYNGFGAPHDDAQAVAWYRKAANQGNADAQVNLGLMYYYGRGVPPDHATSRMWYQMAAEQEDPDAQIKVGMFYKTGDGVLQDYVQAYMWFNLAAMHATDAATKDKAGVVRDELTATMTPAQIAEAQRMAREWVPKK
jgi:uncharacterized protein